MRIDKRTSAHCVNLALNGKFDDSAAFTSITFEAEIGWINVSECLIDRCTGNRPFLALPFLDEDLEGTFYPSPFWNLFAQAYEGLVAPTEYAENVKNSCLLMFCGVTGLPLYNTL
ncbi:hypothetical protein NX02_14880 [Sphingomonas sanxanigenens DSM 19645 = NX02]|uniref:Uncharacterized protein n=1 Tax=Sphingomonas sanxanigenens DSM 19645 = NX02 TaxID=1123269 RepID=W0AG77_9SPHN|nr:hypothetical protein NX02_14880 [Sphingomonas sanxanigenens DSM 19645 = NX02]